MEIKMKKEFKNKIIPIIVVVLFLGGFYFLVNKNSEEITLKIDSILENKITGKQYYSLDCKSFKYTSINIGGFLIPDSSITIENGTEKQVLYVEGEKAKYFGADYDVIQDDDLYLVIMRFYPVSGLTEVVSINKEKGIGFDTNTKSLGMTGGPTTATYLISCSQI